MDDENDKNNNINNNNKSSTENTTENVKPRETDVLFGRGGATLRHPGNQTYRYLVNLNRKLYEASPVSIKRLVSWSIITAIRHQGGRLLKIDDNGTWFYMGDTEAISKTSQAIRDLRKGTTDCDTNNDGRSHLDAILIDSDDNDDDDEDVEAVAVPAAAGTNKAVIPTFAHLFPVNTTTSKSSAKAPSLPQEPGVLIDDDSGFASNSASQLHLQSMITQLNTASQLNTKTHSSRKQLPLLTAASSHNESNDSTCSTAATSSAILESKINANRHSIPSQQQQQQQQQLRRITPKLASLSSETKKHPPVSSERGLVETSLPSPPPPNVSTRGRITLHSHDVVLDWEKFKSNGNEWYRQLIEKHRSSTDDTKPVTAKVIVQAVHQRVPHGRFLKLSLASNNWTVVPIEEAIGKTLNALHAPSQHQQVPSIRSNKRSVRDGDDDNDREATDTNIPPLKKGCVHEVTASSKETKQLPRRYPQETMEIVDQEPIVHSCGISVENKTSHTFEERLTQLADYKKKNGDCNVPIHSKEYGNLGGWVMNQRYYYKNYKEKNKKPKSITKERIRALEKLDFKWQGKRGPAPARLSLLAQKEDDDNEVAAVAPFLPTLEVPPVETVVDRDDEQQIEHKDNDQLLRKNKTSSSSNDDNDGSDNSVGGDNSYRAEEGDNVNNEDYDGVDDSGGWRDLGDEYYNSDDGDCLVF